jgi:excisionase family DNA binding protein
VTDTTQHSLFLARSQWTLIWECLGIVATDHDRNAMSSDDWLEIDLMHESLGRKLRSWSSLIVEEEIDPLLTISEAAAIFRVHKGTIRNWVDKGILDKVVLPNERIRFRTSEIYKKLEGGTNEDRRR